MLEGSLQRQHTPSTVPDSGAVLRGGAKPSGILTLHGTAWLSGNPATLGAVGLQINLLACIDFSTVPWSTQKYFWCCSAGSGFAQRSCRNSFRDAGEACSGHLADI